MSTITLCEPIDIEGVPTNVVMLREPSGPALLELALHVPILTAWGHADAEARKSGARVFPCGKVFAAMVAVAGALTGIGTERAGKLLFADIDRIVARGAPLLAQALAAEPMPHRHLKPPGDRHDLSV